MNPLIEVDERTARSLEFAARISGTNAGQVVRRLVEQASLVTETSDPRPNDGRVPLFADYQGRRTHAMYDPATKRVDVVDGPLDGSSYKSPTGAARAVVGHYNPKVSPHRNGWSFWYLDDGSGRILQSIRYG